MKLIKLTRGLFAKVDNEDYDFLIKYKWQAEPSYKKDGTIGNFYAVCAYKEDGVFIKDKMHRMILGLKRNDGKFVDHKDHDGLNNQRENIRICQHYQNMTNRKKHRGTSKYMGVSLHVTQNKYVSKKTGSIKVYKSASWWAKIVVNETQLSLGHFKSEEEAARCYDKFAKAIHGEFANLNFKTN